MFVMQGFALYHLDDYAGERKTAVFTCHDTVGVALKLK